jgi:hypothetical protein
MAEVYQYVDANGKTVFLISRRRGQGKAGECSCLRPASAPAKAVKSPRKRTDKKNAEIAADNAKVKEQNKKVAQENCKRARENQASLQQNGRIKMPGSNALATDSQRSSLLQQAQQDVQSWCNQ